MSAYPPTIPNENRNSETVSVGDWIVTLILLAIPFVNIILMLVWAFSDGTNANKRNYCRALLIFVAVTMVLGILFVVAFGGYAALMAPHMQPQLNH